MNISELVKKYARHPSLKAFVGMLGKGTNDAVFLESLSGSSVALFFAACEMGRKDFPSVLFVMNDEDEAGYLYHDLECLMGQDRVVFFPSAYRRNVKYAQRDAAGEILRTEVQGRLLAGKGGGLFVVTYPEALAVKVVPGEEVEERSVSVKVGEEIGLVNLEHRLVDIGMHRTDYVYRPGDFSVRGSIVDVFSYSSEYPFRIDFFGDEVDSIRVFNVETQLSENVRSEIVIVPEVENLSLKRESILTAFPEDTMLVCRDKKYLQERIHQIYEEGFSSQARMTHEETHSDECLDKEQMLLTADDFMAETATFRSIFLRLRKEQEVGASIPFHTSPQPLFHKNFELLVQSLDSFLAKDYQVCIMADSPKQIQRLKDIFSEMTPMVVFTPVDKALHAGFYDEDLKLCVFSDHQIFDRFHKYSLRSDKALNGRVAVALKDLLQFQPGDYVVHVDHGIGQFAGLVRVEQGGMEQEMMKLVYQNQSVVYVSIHSLNKVSKYKGREGEAPKLNRLGTGAWEKLKDNTKRKIKDIARDLIRLYSRRRQEKGFAYSPDSYLQHELEASFLYEDTPDQLRVTAEVKKDMESSRPMDRLVCGDVGFGKTEVAVRAAFKAACDGKQVAVLVPTTVLAYQHYQTFCARLKGLPVRVDYLSRARSAEKTRLVKADLAAGKIEILIGTQKLLGKDVRFKDLGLLIIDEEQKFGVATKEKLRQLRVNVDTLTMSATPIPRTLQFSLMGARDLSVIQTPPPNRYPIRTEIHLFGHEVIAEAINFEMSRGGQVFYVCNRIAKLAEVEHLIQKYVPDARIAVGHGQMSPEALEKIIMGFIGYEYDVLLSTTIVENGVDIPNANTIIIDGAHNFGLSDLHQMRGRVGRGNRKAFCYLLAPPLSSLNEESRRRLEAVENFSQLGCGIQIAMQDLDIRGSGNLLGAEQSGFIADLGYETYQKILSEAVAEVRNEEFPDLYAEEEAEDRQALKGDLFVGDCTLDSDLPLYFPEEYIPGSSERMALYRELDTLTTDRQIHDFHVRLEDRFGKVPQEGLDLMKVVILRRMGRSLGVERIVLKHGGMTLYFVSNLDSAFYQSATFGRTLDYFREHFRRCNLVETGGKRRMAVMKVPTVEEAERILRQMVG